MLMQQAQGRGQNVNPLVMQGAAELLKLPHQRVATQLAEPILRMPKPPAQQESEVNRGKVVQASHQLNQTSLQSHPRSHQILQNHLRSLRRKSFLSRPPI